jgi:sigma-B regulation protein RsbU (phosphoserine phosphatase)
MRLVLYQGQSMVTQMTVSGDSLLIGSSPQCHVYLPDMRIALHQLLITRTPDGWKLQQLDTSKPALLNGATIVEDRILQTGDNVAIVDYTLKIYPDVEDRPAVPKPAAPSPAARAGAFQLPADALVKRPDEPIGLAGGRLEVLAQVCFQAASAGSIDEFMRRVLTTLTEALPSRAAWIGLAPDAQGRFAFSVGLGPTGELTDAPDLCRKVQHRCIDRRQYLCLPTCPQSDIGSLIAGPFICGNRPAGLLYLDRSPAQPRFGEAELDALRLLAAQLTPLAGRIAAQQTRQQDHPGAGELAVAHQIQSRLTPRILPRWPDLDILALQEPGTAYVGDIYDVVQLPNNLAAAVVASAVAPGCEPAVMMAEVRAAFRVAALHADAPHVLLRELNWLVYDGQPGHSLCCCTVLLDPARGAMQYSTAGRVGAYIIDSRGRARGLVGVPKSPVGTTAAADYQTNPEQLDPGETLGLFTTGLETLANAAGQNFGRQRLLDRLCKGFSQPLMAVSDDLATEIRIFRQGGRQPDDITALLLRRLQVAPAQA